jgi:hypothetical protein
MKEFYHTKKELEFVAEHSDIHVYSKWKEYAFNFQF